MAKNIDSDAEITSIRLDEQTSAPTPDTGYSHIFAKTDGLYIVDDDDVVTGPFGTGVPQGIGARVYNNANITISDNTATLLTFNSERWDTDDIHSTSSNTGRLTAKTAGKYIIVANVFFQTNAGGRRLVFLYKNGTDVIASFEFADDSAGATSAPRVPITTIYDLDVDDYVTVSVKHTYGSDLDIIYNDGQSPEFMMQLMEVGTTVPEGIGARVYNNANISIPDDTPTALTFNAERWDTDEIHSTVSNTSRLTCKTAGKYLIIGNIQWVSEDADTRRSVLIKINGTTYISTTDSDSGANATSAQNTTTIYDLAVDDYVELFVLQASGGSLNVRYNANMSPEFSMQLIEVGRPIPEDIGARVYDTSDQTLSTGTWTALTFDTEDYDTDTIHSTVSNTSRLTCKTAGKYIMVGTIYWESSAVGARAVRIFLNNTTNLVLNRQPVYGSDGQNATAIYELDVDDYVELHAQQESGGDLDVLTSSGLSPTFSMQRIG